MLNHHFFSSVQDGKKVELVSKVLCRQFPLIWTQINIMLAWSVYNMASQTNHFLNICSY